MKLVYLQYVPMWHALTEKVMNDRLLHKSLFQSRRKSRTLSKRLIQLDNLVRIQIRPKRFSDWQGVYWWNPGNSCFNILPHFNRYLSHYLHLAGHPGERWMYNTVRREFYWLHMANNGYKTVFNGQELAQKHGVKRRWVLLRFPTSGPVEFVVMAIIGPVPKMLKGNEFMLVMHRNSKLTSAVSTYKKTVSRVLFIFVDKWIITHGISTYLLTDICHQFMNNLFKKLCTFLGTNNFMKTTCQIKTNGKAERLNQMIIAGLRQ